MLLSASYKTDYAWIELLYLSLDIGSFGRSELGHKNDSVWTGGKTHVDEVSKSLCSSCREIQVHIVRAGHEEDEIWSEGETEARESGDLRDYRSGMAFIVVVGHITSPNGSDVLDRSIGGDLVEQRLSVAVSIGTLKSKCDGVSQW